MVEANKIKYSVMENILPPEMVEKILKLLTFKDICRAQLTCKRWKEIIDQGNFMKKIKGKASINLKLFN